MAVENGVQNAELGYLLFPFEQYSNLAGKPLVGGHMEIYEAGTDTKYISMQNWDGAENPFRIPIPNDGRITVLADPTKTFDCYLYDSYNNLVCSRLNVQANVPGNISIKGGDTILKNTDGTLDIYLRTLGNNVREYTVNTHNKVLDVQEPLYFVENSNTATVIGFSGDNYVQKDYLTDFVSSSISGKMDVSKLEYNEDGEISAYDGSAFAGQGAGDPEVNDLVHSNSATWNDVSAKLDTTAFSTVSGDFLTAIPDEYATKDYVQSSVSSKLDSTAFSTVSGSFLTAHQSLDDYLTKVSADGLYYPLNSNPSGYLTAHQDLSQYAKTDDLTAYQEKGDYYSASNPSGFLTKSSADTLYQPTGDYATHDDLTAYQPSGNYADATALDGKVDTSSFTAFSSTTNEKIEYISGALSGTYELSAGNGIDITDYPNEQKTVISVTAQGGNPEVEAEVIAHSADWNTVGDKLDTTAFSTVSGTFLTAHQSLDGYATTEDVESAVSSKLDTTAFSEVSGSFLTAHQDISNLMPKSESANFYPMTGNPSGFLTAHQDLSDYATTAELANKLDTTAFSDVSGTFLTAHQDISNKLDTTAFSDVSGSFLTAIPETYLQNTDLTISDGKITEISGVLLSAGDELPEVVSAAADYVSANSATINGTIDTVSSNSASWGGEALPLSSRDGIDLEISGDMLYIGASALSAAISAKQDELTFDYNASNAISAINGSALAGGGGGGGDVPEGVMAESGLEYNAVNEISGYNGSAIAQYGAEKQWLVHDDTLVHAANSAQYAMGVNVSAVQTLMGLDETILFEGDALHNNASATLSEPFTNFEKIKVYGHTDDGVMYPWFTEVPTFSGISFIGVATNNAGWSKWFGLSVPDTTHIVPHTGYVVTWGSTTTGYLQNTWGITRVIGIGRKEV